MSEHSFFDTTYTRYLKGEEDFRVDEVIDPKFTRKFLVRGRSVEKMSGMYSLCVLRKKGRTTDSVIRELKRKLGIRDIGYAGLKDKHAVTSQFVTIKDVSPAKVEAVKMVDASLTFQQQIDKHISIGDLVGNRFKIRLHGADAKRARKNAERVAKGFPNFFGPQRFGSNLNNHLKGKKILKKELREGKEKAKFLIHAYQSWIFNLALEQYTGEPLTVSVPGFGFTKTGNDMEKEMVRLMEEDGISPRDFRIDELRLSCNGAKRNTFVTCSDFVISEPLVLEFMLPRGSYATTLLQQILRYHL